jgi:hypothetical protein
MYFDEPHDQAVGAGEVGQVDQAVVVDAPLDDHVELDQPQPGLVGGGDPL